MSRKHREAITGGPIGGRIDAPPHLAGAEVADVGYAGNVEMTAPPVFSRTVRYVDGQLGEALEKAKRDIRAEARKQRLGVKSFVKSPIQVLGLRTVEKGQNPDKSPRLRVERDCEFTISADVTNRLPEKWVRLTSASGPAAVEVLTTEGGQVTSIETVHAEDVRQVAMGFAEMALRENAG